MFHNKFGNEDRRMNNDETWLEWSDYWLKVPEMLLHNWALVEPSATGASC